MDKIELEKALARAKERAAEEKEFIKKLTDELADKKPPRGTMPERGELGETMRAMRMEAGLDAKTMATALKLTSAVVTCAERESKIIKFTRITGYAKVLNCKASDIILRWEKAVEENSLTLNP